MSLSEKEKLEEELRFLKESLDIGVITKEEFISGKERISKRLEQLGKLEGRSIEIDGLDIEEPKGQQSDDEADTSQFDKDLLEPRENFEPSEEKAKPKEDEDEIDEKFFEPKSAKISSPRVQAQKQIPRKEGRKISRKLVIIPLAFLFIAFGIWFVFGAFNADGSSGDENKYACYSDNDCRQDGKLGSCSNAGTKSAECTFVEDARVKLIVVNTDECFNCNTERVIEVIKGFYPNVEIETADIKTEKGRSMAQEFGLEALPAYIMNSSLQETHNYRKFEGAFRKENGYFVMKEIVANSNYFINRNEVASKLDFFAQDGQEASAQAERNLREFLSSFEGKVNFEKHGSGSAMAKELGINSFPAFLVNNKIKFSGVQPADIIKDNFCSMNEMGECKQELSKSLI